MKVKEMPFEERLQSVRGYVAGEESVLFPLVRKRLGENAVQELRAGRDKVTHKLPDDASVKDKYEQEYAAWIHTWAISYDFIRERLGDSGIKEFEHDDIELLRRMNSSFALSVLGLVRAVSKERAFKMLKGQLAYNLQAISPLTVSESTRNRLTFDLPSCKVLETPGGERFCQAFCGVIFPRWMKYQLHVLYETQRQGKSCKLTIMPE